MCGEYASLYIFRSYNPFSPSILIARFAGAKTQQGNHYYYVTPEIDFKNVYDI